MQKACQNSGKALFTSLHAGSTRCLITKQDFNNSRSLSSCTLCHVDRSHSSYPGAVCEAYAMTVRTCKGMKTAHILRSPPALWQIVRQATSHRCHSRYVKAIFRVEADQGSADYCAIAITCCKLLELSVVSYYSPSWRGIILSLTIRTQALIRYGRSFLIRMSQRLCNVSQRSSLSAQNGTFCVSLCSFYLQYFPPAACFVASRNISTSSLMGCH